MRGFRQDKGIFSMVLIDYPASRDPCKGGQSPRDDYERFALSVRFADPFQSVMSLRPLRALVGFPGLPEPWAASGLFFSHTGRGFVDFYPRLRPLTLNRVAITPESDSWCWQ